MRRLLYLFVVLTGFSSCCSECYSIQGTSSVSSLDGSKLYLKAVQDKEVKNIDSCEVVHGKFEFSGSLDTIMMVNLFMDDRPLMMPLVLEEGDIIVRIDDASRKVSGTQLNDILYEFIDQHTQLSNRMNELSHRESQMLLDGIDERDISNVLSGEAERIAEEEDSLVTNFIVENFDNVLGPGVFMMLTAGYQFPILTPQIEHLMSIATEKFKNDSYVKEYFKTANEIQAKLQGLEQPAAPSSEPSDSLIQSILNGQ